MSKSIWGILIICIAGFIIWTSIYVLLPLWNYYRLDTPIPVSVNQWEIKKLGGSDYAVVALFSYEVKGEKYEGRTQFQKPYYPNYYAAEDQIKRFSKRAWKGWVNSKNPHIAALEKPFPYLKIFYAFVILGVLLYFVYLYLATPSKSN